MDMKYGQGTAASCWAFAPGKPVPDEWWRKIELIYPDGKIMTLLYRAEPADPAELPQVMLQLQIASATNGFRVVVTTEDGTVTEADPIETRR